MGHYQFRLVLAFDDNVNVIGPDVGGFHRPSSVLGTDQDRLKNNLAARMVHFIRRLIHKASLRSLPSGMGSDQRCSEKIVARIY